MDKRKKTTKKRRRRGKGRGRLLFILTVLSVAVVLCVVMFFKVDEIAVESPVVYTQEQITAASGIEIGQNIFTVRLGEVQKRLLAQFPYISTVKVSRALPSRIVISFSGEHAAFAAVASAGKYTVLTRSCKVLEQASGSVMDNLIAVYGVDLSAYQPGSGVKETEEAKNGKEGQTTDENTLDVVYALDQLYTAFESIGLSDVTYIDVSDVMDIHILFDDRALIRIGSVLDAEQKLRVADQVLSEDLPADFEGRVDVRIDNKAYTRACDISELLNPVYITQSIIKY